jgi:hypothetical protein
MQAFRRRAAVLGIVLCAAGCDRPEAARPALPDAIALGEAVRWTGRVGLEENPQALVVSPFVNVDSRGGFLVADQQEAQVRRYGADGRLLWRQGRKGAGPGEYSGPTGAVRLPSGEVLAVDGTGRLTRYDSAGTSVLQTTETEIHRVEELVLVDEHTVLVGGVLQGELDAPRLHLWDVRSGRVLGSFFSPLRNARNRTVSVVAGWTKASIRGDTVAAIFSTSDTVYLFTTRGREIGKIPIPSRFFRHGPAGGPDRTLTNPGEQARWMSQFDFVEGVHWLPNGSLLVAYQNMRPERALQRQRHLVHMTRAGRRLFEIRDGPRLLEVDGRSGNVIFVDPGAEVPNRWAIARLRN